VYSPDTARFDDLVQQAMPIIESVKFEYSLDSIAAAADPAAAASPCRALPFLAARRRRSRCTL
jgi:hypothetical protein